MKVEELILALAELSPNLDVVLALDEDGNSSSELDDVSGGFHFPDNGWVYRDTEEVSDAHDEHEHREKVVVLWPRE